MHPAVGAGPHEYPADVRRPSRGKTDTQAAVKRLILCHLVASFNDQADELRLEARQTYHGPVEIQEEFRAYRVGGH